MEVRNASFPHTCKNAMVEKPFKYELKKETKNMYIFKAL
jgi:hypothetical protein